jgi:hypothetical protein
MNKRYVTKAEEKRVLAAIKDPLVKAVAKRMFGHGERAGAALASMRKLDWHICLQCKELFSGIKTAKYCTNACRQAAKRERKVA